MNPDQILKLWLKTIKLHDRGRKPTEFPPKVREQKLKIKNGLTRLRTQAADVATESKQTAFTRTRDQTVKLMLLYLRYLKTNPKDEDKRLLPKYIVTVKRLTSVVKTLDPKQLSDDDRELSLEHLEQVDTSAVDQALTGDADESEADELEAVEDDGADDAAHDAETEYRERREALEADLQRALHEQRGDLVKLRTVYDYIQQKAKQGAFEQAVHALDKLEQLLEAADAGAAGGKAESADFEQLWKAASDGWQAAVESVDQQITQLVKALKESGIEELKEVTEFGLSGVTGNYRVPLSAALRNVAAARGETRKKEAARAEVIVAGFKKHLAASELVLVCDENPFGVPVTIRQTLSQALDRLDHALDQA